MPEIDNEVNILTEICGVCGEAISESEIGIEFWGNFVMYSPRRGRGLIDFVICTHCAPVFTERQEEIAAGNIEKAVERRSKRWNEYL